MDLILKEQGFQQSGACTEQSCVVSMGQMLGVKYMVAGTVGNVGKIFVLSLKVIDVSTGEIGLTVSESCACAIEEVLLTSTKNVAVKLDNALFRSSHAEVVVETRPPGAMVFLNGTMYGETPFSSSTFAEGNFRLKLTRAGYVTALDSFAVSKGKTVKKTIALEMTRERRIRSARWRYGTPCAPSRRGTPSNWRRGGRNNIRRSFARPSSRLSPAPSPGVGMPSTNRPRTQSTRKPASKTSIRRQSTRPRCRH